MNLPTIVSQSEWDTARERLLAKEKEATRARDALAAERRRQPMTRIHKEYVFEGPGGKANLADIFDGRRQLIVYHFMLRPGESHYCEGCSMFVDNLGHPAHLNARDTTLALISRAPLTEITPLKERMGWTLPWYSSHGTDFNTDLGLTTKAGEAFGLSVFLRDGDEVYRTYFTSERGVEALGSNWTLLDLTPLGRQETWEDTPDGRPQEEPYGWWRLHDEYDN
ncbi:DUF899 domain-containing protein [Micromonospora sp. DT62]|uniref:DUF899 domain-containing protein n=1 Tax=Micromonospora sp. DT62 TaxID=3416521 RepID=UPI003CEA735F